MNAACGGNALYIDAFGFSAGMALSYNLFIRFFSLSISSRYPLDKTEGHTKPRHREKSYNLKYIKKIRIATPKCRSWNYRFFFRHSMFVLQLKQPHLKCSLIIAAWNLRALIWLERLPLDTNFFFYSVPRFYFLYRQFWGLPALLCANYLILYTFSFFFN